MLIKLQLLICVVFDQLLDLWGCVLNFEFKGWVHCLIKLLRLLVLRIGIAIRGEDIVVKNIFHLIFPAIRMFSSCPLVIKVGSDFSVLLLLICFFDKGMMKEVGPAESLTGSFVKKSLKKRFEFWTHIVREFHRVFDDQMNQCVD